MNTGVLGGLNGQIKKCLNLVAINFSCSKINNINVYRGHSVQVKFSLFKYIVVLQMCE